MQGRDRASFNRCLDAKVVNDLLNWGDCLCICLTFVRFGNYVPHFGIHGFGGPIQCVNLTPISYWAIRLLGRRLLLSLVKFLDTLIGIHIGKNLVHDLGFVEMVDMLILGLQELRQAIPVFTLCHESDYFNEVALVPGWKSAPNLAEHIVILVDHARKKRTHLKL